MDDPDFPVRLFSYGTLQDHQVQLALYGRRLAGRADFLPGWALRKLVITDPEVVRLSGQEVHQIACRTGRAEDRIAGMVYALTTEELATTDRYEVDAYGRILVELGSGDRAFAYIGADGDETG